MSTMNTSAAVLDPLILDENGRRGDWILLEEGAMKGMNIIVDQSTEEVISLSTRHCRDVERWKEGMPSLEANLLSLQTLDLDSSRYLTELNPSVGSLQQLRRLFLTRCDRLERLPDSICSLGNLQEVRIREGSLPTFGRSITRSAHTGFFFLSFFSSFLLIPLWCALFRRRSEMSLGKL